MGHSYRDLVAWQRARALATEIYRATSDFPKTEVFGITAQMRRAAVSVACNIAEGQGRLTKGEFGQFLGMARGSLLELETQISISSDLGYLSEASTDHLSSLTAEVLRLLNALTAAMRPRP